MTFYNPDIYNYENLSAEGKGRIDEYDHALYDLDNALTNCQEFIGQEDATIIEKITREIQEEYAERVLDYMYSFRQEYITAIIDSEAIEE